jgi:exonuclease SbcC
MDDYEVVLIDCVDNSKMKHLSQLSGGEQMSVAISIRLAMLKQIANVEFYFMDEPTINLDYERRMMVAEVVKDMSNELRQLFVISHDDTFESITDNTIKIEKYNNTSKLC